MNENISMVITAHKVRHIDTNLVMMLNLEKNNKNSPGDSYGNLQRFAKLEVYFKIQILSN
jgi:hypothetical protein